MHVRTKTILGLIAAAGTVAGFSSGAPAQPAVIHISGATLLENLLNARGSSNDFIDADGNGQSRAHPSPFTQQLAPFALPASGGSGAVWPSSVKWGILYDAVGSGNGFQELVNVGRTFTAADGLSASTCVAGGTSASTDLPISRRTVAYFNRYKYLLAGNANDDNSGIEGALAGVILNDANPGGAPIRADFTNAASPSFLAVYTTPGNSSASRPNYTTTCAINGANPTINRLAFRNEALPGGVPSTGSNEGLSSSLVGGQTIDIAVLDVPSSYATTQSGAAGPDLNPLQPGYGNNARLAMNADGSLTANPNSAFNNNGGNKLTALSGGANLSATQSGTYNPAADGNTVFDTPVVFAPIAPVINFGVGVSEIRMSDLRHLFGAGRMASGENLMVVTRDSGSGTRNGFQNSIGQDPSFGVGDNLGARNNDVPSNRLGSSFVPSNKGGNNRVEPAVINHRLAIGYVGPERGTPNAATGDPGWLDLGQMEIASVINDFPYGGTQPTRPTITQVLGNGPNGWVIGGPGGFSTFGDPLSAPEHKGGLGWMEPFTDSNANSMYDLGEPFTDINQNTVRDAAEARPATLNPAMRNVEAAAFLNNFSRSVKAFVSLPGSDETLFTPGELAAVRFILVAAQDRVQDSIDPTNLLSNPGQVSTLKDFYLNSTVSVLSSNLYAAFGNGVTPAKPANSRAGKVPERVIPSTSATNIYSDKLLIPDGNAYITESGATLTYGSNLPLRNLIAGDFSGDGKRNLGDITEMLKAYRKRAEGAVWAAPGGSGALATLAGTLDGSSYNSIAGADLSIEIIGDFNGDGSFDKKDVRYFADGLAMTTGGSPVLNRKQGFIDVDTAYLAAGGASINFFGTTLASGKAYIAGDSRGDLTGSARNTGANAVGLQKFRAARGFAPVGADGVIDANDVDYVYANFKQSGISGAADWSDLNEAVLFDLSADITGDLKVDQADVDELVTVILGTCKGDVNLNGRVNLADRAVVDASIATPPASVSWASGDVNGDGIVNAADRVIVCPADFNCDGIASIDDLFLYFNAYFTGNPKADMDDASGVAIDDLFLYINQYFVGC